LRIVPLVVFDSIEELFILFSDSGVKMRVVEVERFLLLGGREVRVFCVCGFFLEQLNHRLILIASGEPSGRVYIRFRDSACRSRFFNYVND
jgi:hypothetical protein